MKTSLFFIAILIWVGKLSAQKPQDTSSFRVGIYAGYYIPGDATARYYNGSDDNRLRNYIDNPQLRIRQDIEESLGNRDFSIAELAQDMTYQSEFSFQLSAAIRFGNNWQIAARLHNVKLTATGVFTLNVADPTNPTGPTNNLEQVNIMGKETRSHIDIGLGKQISLGKQFYFLGEAGLDMNFVEVTENKMNVAGDTYNLPIFTNRLNPQASQPITFGIGFYGQAGIGYQFPNSYGFWLQVNYLQTNIDVNRVVEENTGIVILGLGFTKAF